MAGTNLTVCTEEPSTHNTTTMLSISRSLLTTGLSKKNNFTYLDEYCVNTTDRTNKFRRAKRSENELNPYGLDYVLKPSEASETNEPVNIINNPPYTDKKNNSDSNNIMYDYDFETKHNADRGKYNIDELEYIVKGKYLSSLAQNYKSLYFSQPTYKNKIDLSTNNQQKLPSIEMIEEFDTIESNIDQQQDTNISKYIYMNQPNQKQVLFEPAHKNNNYGVLESVNETKIIDEDHVDNDIFIPMNPQRVENIDQPHNNKNYDGFKFSNEAKLIHKSQYHIDNDYSIKPISKPQRFENSNQSLDNLVETLANRARDANKPLSTDIPENVNIKEWSEKQKYKREGEEKYLFDEYGSINTLMIDTTRKSPFDKKIFTRKLITSSNIEEQKTNFSRPSIRMEVTTSSRKLETELIQETPFRQEHNVRQG